MYPCEMGETGGEALSRAAEAWAEASAELPALPHGDVSLARIMAATPGAFCALRLREDGSARCDYVSDNVRQVCHVSAAEFARDPEASIDPRDSERVSACIAQAARDKTAFRCEYRVQGEHDAWVEAHAVPVADDDGQLVWCGSLRDATERKLLERQLQLKSDALENSLNAFAMLSKKGRFLYANRTYLRMWGFEHLEELLGATPYDHCVDPTIPGRITHALLNGENITLEFTAKRRDGSTFETLMSVQRITDQRGLERYMGTAIDITERKRAEDGMRRAQTRLLAALDAGQMGTWSHELLNDGVWMDEACLRIWGRSHKEVDEGGRDAVLSYIHPDDRPLLQAATAAALVQERGPLVEFRINKADGSQVWLSARGTVERDLQGNPVRVLGVSADITQRKAGEETQLRSQKLEALGTLAGGIAHDFNNMLLAVLGNTALVSEALSPADPLQGLLAQITNAGERAAELVKHILTFSRPQDQKRTRLQLVPVLNEALKLVRATLPARVEIRTEFASDVPLVMSDVTELHQLVINLSTNAAHAIGERPGLLELTLEGVSLAREPSSVSDGMREGRYARLTVRDDGCGMDRATLERIFDPFFTTKPVGMGTGLGLSVVHGIMRSSGGAIRVESQRGQGSCFQLYFPAVSGEFSPTRVEQTVTPRGRGERVLVIDDEPALVKLAEQALSGLGYQVTGFDNPVAALERFCKEPSSFDAVISDMSMPKLSGIDVLRAVRAVRPTMPLILLSGYLRPEEQAAAQALGVHELLHKPTSYHLIGSVLYRLLSVQPPPP
jgi:PAS domain S-box-containing protein